MPRASPTGRRGCARLRGPLRLLHPELAPGTKRPDGFRAREAVEPPSNIGRCGWVHESTMSAGPGVLLAARLLGSGPAAEAEQEVGGAEEAEDRHRDLVAQLALVPAPLDRGRRRAPAAGAEVGAIPLREL